MPRARPEVEPGDNRRHYGAEQVNSRCDVRQDVSGQDVHGARSSHSRYDRRDLYWPRYWLVGNLQWH